MLSHSEERYRRQKKKMVERSYAHATYLHAVESVYIPHLPIHCFVRRPASEGVILLVSSRKAKTCSGYYAETLEVEEVVMRVFLLVHASFEHLRWMLGSSCDGNLVAVVGVVVVVVVVVFVVRDGIAFLVVQGHAVSARQDHLDLMDMWSYVYECFLNFCSDGYP